MWYSNLSRDSGRWDLCAGLGELGTHTSNDNGMVQLSVLYMRCECEIAEGLGCYVEAATVTLLRSV